MYTVYVLKSVKRNYLYVGITNNLERRFAEHQSGHNRTTAPYRPFGIIYTKDYSTRVGARIYERYLKSGSGKEWIKREVLKVI